MSDFYDNFKWKCPIPLAKKYGGELMAVCLQAAQSHADSHSHLVSFSIHFVCPADREAPTKIVPIRLGGGNTISYISVDFLQDKLCSRAECIFSRPEETGYSADKAVHGELPTDGFVEYKKYKQKQIARERGISEDLVDKMFAYYKAFVDHMADKAEVEIAEHRGREWLSIRFRDAPRSPSEFAQGILYLSDFLMVAHASDVISYPWYDHKKSLINSLTHGGSFIPGACAERVFLEMGLSTFAEGKAHVCCQLYDEEGKRLGQLEQHVLLRERQN